MKLLLQYVGVGLFLSGLLFTLNNQFDFIDSGISTEASNEKALENKEREIEKLRKQVTELKEEKYNDVAKENESLKDNASNANKDSNQNSANNSGKENEIVKSAVIIYENMSLYEIGQQVEDLKLIENGRQLELFLSKPEYSRSVQKGSFDLSSDMTVEEMANIITAKKPQ